MLTLPRSICRAVVNICAWSVAAAIQCTANVITAWALIILTPIFLFWSAITTSLALTWLFLLALWGYSPLARIAVKIVVELSYMLILDGVSDIVWYLKRPFTQSTEQETPEDQQPVGRRSRALSTASSFASLAESLARKHVEDLTVQAQSEAENTSDEEDLSLLPTISGFSSPELARTPLAMNSFGDGPFQRTRQSGRSSPVDYFGGRLLYSPDAILTRSRRNSRGG